MKPIALILPIFAAAAMLTTGCASTGESPGGAAGETIQQGTAAESGAVTGDTMEPPRGGEEIYDGMTGGQVAAILGPPDRIIPVNLELEPGWQWVYYNQYILTFTRPTGVYSGDERILRGILRINPVEEIEEEAPAE